MTQPTNTPVAERDIQRVFQTKAETKAFYNKISHVYDLLAEHSEGPPMRRAGRVLRPGGRLAVVGVSKEGDRGLILRVYEGSHRHFPNLVDCRPIFVRRSIEAAGFHIESAAQKSMWVPVEIVLGVKPDGAVGAGSAA